MWDYEAYIKRRKELIKQGMNYTNASNQAHREIHGEELLSPANS